MKAIQEQVDVQLSPAGQPLRFSWRSKRYSVQVLDMWRYGGRWWWGEAPRNCFLVQSGTLLAELHQELNGPWWLARVQD